MAERRLLYVANNRLPTEKAHGLQIAQMCEAFAAAGCAVTLVTARRRNTPAMRKAGSLWDYYGVARRFGFVRLPCLDLHPLLPLRFSRLAFLTQTITYLLVLAVWLLFRRVDIVYTRDLFAGGLLMLLKPRATLVYEVHQLHHSRWGSWLQDRLLQHAYVVALTGHLAERVRARGATRVTVEHDGVRTARFAAMPTRAEARSRLDLNPDTFVVGYVGQLHTMGVPKGLDTLVDAIAHAGEDGTAANLLLVGGPADGVDAVRVQWHDLGLPPERLHAVGRVSPDEVPVYLAAMDAGALPLPWTEHFAYYASAIKLFEYMAAGLVVLASDLPSTAEVVQDGVTALLCPPGDASAFGEAIRRLAHDPALVARLGAAAQAEVTHYTWEARAQRICAFVEGDAS